MCIHTAGGTRPCQHFTVDAGRVAAVPDGVTAVQAAAHTVAVAFMLPGYT